MPAPQNNSHALHDGSTIHVDGRTKRNREGRIFLDTPTFLERVSIDIGMVALDVAVENANAITGKIS